ncbi:uncharacterized protein LOC105702968, partial [Orussus abietinus]|uniref:uncharacterized protein LOC105702968 n=1 Tax=Orussus abietinus TaxID=222816 RepID=UPI000C7162A6
MAEEQQQSSSIKPTMQRLLTKQDDLAAFLDTCTKNIESTRSPAASYLHSQIEELNATWNNFKINHAKVLEDPHAASLAYVKEDLRSSEGIATKQWLSSERRLNRSQKTAAEYTKFLQEYLTLNHMESVPARESSQAANAYYLPHHAVIRDASLTTKLRVVFNASQKTNSGRSLNDCLLTGGKLQRDLPAIVMNWRNQQFAFTADIEKMYRQIRVHPEDTDLQRIVWRSTPQHPLTSYRLLTVTYGTACAPYLAIRVLHQLASDEQANFPQGAAALLNHFYVDDVLSGADSLESARAIQQQLIAILKSGGFHLRKWVSNHPALLEQVPVEERLQTSLRSLQPDQEIRTLGIGWNPVNDTFQFQITQNPIDEHPTKRTILSAIARLFDPLGWLAPVIIKAKILLQRLWLAQ